MPNPNVIQIRDKDGKALYPITEASLVIGMEPGVSIDSVTTPTIADGTALVSLSNGDTITLDLNHNHPQYLKYVMLNSESEMPANPDPTTLYMWPQS